MKKYIAVVLFVFLLLFTLTSCVNITVVVGETKTHEITSEIHSLDIQINAADFIIEHGDRFSVESNLKYLSISEHNGVLTIVEEQKLGIHYTDAALKLCVPNDIVFEEIDITTGAAKLTADSLSANSVELKLGAGKVQFECLNAYTDADIIGGAGEITIASGTLNNLTLEMGVGELNLSIALLGNSDLEFGVGNSKLTLIGNKEDYRVDVKKGIGSISVDGKNVSDFGSSGNGQNNIKVQGGVGAVDIVFKAE
jgi:DUF4097 and DUF4098 domain-containing protein YvlB